MDQSISVRNVRWRGHDFARPPIPGKALMEPLRDRVDGQRAGLRAAISIASGMLSSCWQIRATARTFVSVSVNCSSDCAARLLKS